MDSAVGDTSSIRCQRKTLVLQMNGVTPSAWKLCCQVSLQKSDKATPEYTSINGRFWGFSKTQQPAVHGSGFLQRTLGEPKCESSVPGAPCTRGVQLRSCNVIDFHGNVQSHFSPKAISKNCHLSTISTVELYINWLQHFAVAFLMGTVFHSS